MSAAATIEDVLETAPLRAEIERLTAERDEYAAIDCSVQHDMDRAALGVASLRAETAQAERDTLAAALAEVREIHAALVAHDSLPREAWSEAADAKHVELSERLDAAMVAIPADLAAERDRRVRAEALEAAADAVEDVPGFVGCSPAWLRARAAEERGGR